MATSLNLIDKYRPKNLDECIGLGDYKESITNMIMGTRKPHFIMLTGGSGLGKTTLERIIAKSFYCPNFKKNRKPCEECPNCKAFNKYIETSDASALEYVYEINASKDNGKQAMTTIVNEAQYPAPTGELKIFLLDEAHNLSPSAQDTVLKPLESHTEGTIFVFGTTDPQMLKSTIHTRVNFSIHLEKPKPEEVVGLLKRICEEEEFKYQESALMLLAERELEKANGGTRSCVNLLSQVLISKGSITHKDLEEFYNDLPTSTYSKYMKTLINNEVTENISLIYLVKSRIGLKRFVEDLIDYVKKGIYVKNGIPLKSITVSEVSTFKNLFEGLSIVQIRNLLNALLTALRSDDLESNLMLLAFDGISSNEDKIFAMKPLNIHEDVTKEAKNEDKFLSKVKKEIEEKRREESKKASEELVLEGINPEDDW